MIFANDTNLFISDKKFDSLLRKIQNYKNRCMALTKQIIT